VFLIGLHISCFGCARRVWVLRETKRMIVLGNIAADIDLKW
jgi:hypothetical protein